MGPRRAGWSLFVLIALALVAACSSTTYGARRYSVAFESTPDGADLYLVKYTKWELSDGPALLEAYQRARSEPDVRAALDELANFLAPHLVSQGVTPVSVEVIAHEQLLVAIKGDQFASTRFVPRPDGKSDQSLLLRAHRALEGS